MTQCETCEHYNEPVIEYDWCHMCKMLVHDCYKPKQGKEVEQTLKPCPLCGGQVSWNSGFIECNCGIKFHAGGSREFQENKWNKRCEQR